MKKLKEVFLRFANLKIDPKKCVLFDKNVKYLGHVSIGGVTRENCNCERLANSA